MPGFNDSTRAIDERNEARMSFRTKPRIKTAIQQPTRTIAPFDSGGHD